MCLHEMITWPDHMAACGLQEIAQDVKDQLSKPMESFGISIIQTLVTDIEPAAKVKAAMNEVRSGLQLRSSLAKFRGQD